MGIVFAHSRYQAQKINGDNYSSLDKYQSIYALVACVYLILLFIIYYMLIKRLSKKIKMGIIFLINLLAIQLMLLITNIIIKKYCNFIVYNILLGLDIASNIWICFIVNMLRSESLLFPVPLTIDSKYLLKNALKCYGLILFFMLGITIFIYSDQKCLNFPGRTIVFYQYQWMSIFIFCLYCFTIFYNVKTVCQLKQFSVYCLLPLIQIILTFILFFSLYFIQLFIVSEFSTVIYCIVFSICLKFQLKQNPDNLTIKLTERFQILSDDNSSPMVQ